jgi:hypothetical protein
MLLSSFAFLPEFYVFKSFFLSELVERMSHIFLNNNNNNNNIIYF